MGWAANRAHHADVGGAAPGSMPADATEIHQEGLRLPPVLLTPGVRAVFLANSRTPRERAGDLDAQVGANVVGIAPAGRARGRGGARWRRCWPTASGGCGRRSLSIPDGQWSFEDVLDSTGPLPDQQRPVRIACTLTKAGDELYLRLHGHRPAAAGQRERGRSRDRERGRLRRAGRGRPDHPGQRRLAAAGPRAGRARARSSRLARPPPWRPATSRSASAWPTCASARWPRPCRAGWARPARAR